MYQLINLSQFRTAFATHCGGQYANNFTYEGLEVFYDYLEYIAAESHGVQLDIIALCSEFAEYTWDEARGMLDDAETLTEEELHARLEERTIVCGATDTTVIVLQF